MGFVGGEEGEEVREMLGNSCFRDLAFGDEALCTGAIVSPEVASGCAMIRRTLA